MVTTICLCECAFVKVVNNVLYGALSLFLLGARCSYVCGRAFAGGGAVGHQVDDRPIELFLV